MQAQKNIPVCEEQRRASQTEDVLASEGDPMAGLEPGMLGAMDFGRWEGTGEGRSSVPVTMSMQEARQSEICFWCAV